MSCLLVTERKCGINGVGYKEFRMAHTSFAIINGLWLDQLRLSGEPVEPFL